VSKAHFVRTAVFLAFAAGGLVLFFMTDTWWAGSAQFAGAGIVGGLISEWLFRRLATPDEKRLDLEDRVSNSDF
jgi:hypothetical protein